MIILLQKVRPTTPKPGLGVVGHREEGGLPPPLPSPPYPTAPNVYDIFRPMCMECSDRPTQGGLAKGEGGQLLGRPSGGAGGGHLDTHLRVLPRSLESHSGRASGARKGGFQREANGKVETLRKNAGFCAKASLRIEYFTPPPPPTI